MNPPHFGGFLANSPIFPTPDTTSPSTNWGIWGARNYRTHKTTRNPAGRYGAPKFSRPDGESAAFWWIHPEFPNIPGTGAPFPTTKWRMWETKTPKTKDNPQKPAELYGTRKRAYI